MNKAAGRGDDTDRLGEMSAQRGPEPDAHGETDAPIVIVGTGPAGVRAAQTLVEAGYRPIVIDEQARAGGQIYRRQPVGFVRDARTLYGFEARRAQSIHATFDALLPHIDYRPQTLVWHASAGTLSLFETGETPRFSQIDYRRLLLCTGAVDRVMPFAGWTLPGVYTLGAAQVALKSQGCSVGQRVVLAGSGPLLYLLAYQYVKAGAHVLAVLDSSTFGARLRALPRLRVLPAVLAKGLYYIAWLRLRGVPMHDGVTGWDALSEDGNRIEGIRWHDRAGRTRQIDCDALATGFGLRSETQLADLLGCAFDFDTVNEQWLPRRDADGRSSVPQIYLAGDGSGIAGADAAEAAGRRAALAVLSDLGATIDPAHKREWARDGRLAARIGAFREGIEAAFAAPSAWLARADDALIVCRCEEVRAGDIRRSVADGAIEMNRVKALCRAGMGRCQGRICAAATARIVADARHCTIAEVGRWRAQPPLKPIPFGVVATEEPEQ
ncbi:FAD/NAD(P)-binding oxidoreductase [Robbsia sp. KACC 23696]|uniref:FAD/NAD(P)-dependent oxidoreductase n=1 Tax=Robbsia sp. KACC 23696 TaxID=3149231 RepID=UPI00325AC93F